MVCDLSSHLIEEKKRDIVQRLNSKEPEQSLGAEVELALAWSFRNLDLDVEPFWWANGRSPDIYVEGLIPDRGAAIEVSAFAEAAISGESLMDPCAQKLIDVANAERPGSGQYLYFHFAETRCYQRGRNERGIAAPKDFVPSPETMQKLQMWIKSAPTPKARLRIEDSELIVELEMTAHKQIRYHNYHVPRPPRTYSDTRNPLYRRLADKAEQVANAPLGVCRIIILVEAGSRYLASIAKRDWFNDFESYSKPQDVIQKFVDDKSEKTDAVVVVVPVVDYGNRSSGQSQTKKYWFTKICCSNKIDSNVLTVAVESVIAQLPPPRFDGYNARSLIRQKAMQKESVGWYLMTSIITQNEKVTYKMSSRAFQDFLASRINETQFHRFIGEREEGATMGRFLDKGYTIQAVKFESGGIDADDDYIVLELARDAAAAPFE